MDAHMDIIVYRNKYTPWEHLASEVFLHMNRNDYVNILIAFTYLSCYTKKKMSYYEKT